MATARAGLVVLDGLGQQVPPVEYTFVKKGRKLRLPPVLEVWRLSSPYRPSMGRETFRLLEDAINYCPLWGTPPMQENAIMCDVR